MKRNDTQSQFKAKLLSPANSGCDGSWAFILIPKTASAKLPRRGRTTVMVNINGCGFQATLEPDGELSHWLRMNKDQLANTGVNIGDMVAIEMMSVQQEPEPEKPADFAEALVANPEARAIWDKTTVIARLDWIHWITSAKQSKPRVKRIADACDMLASGKRRVCCFDSSGYYSKALSAPKAAN